MRKALVLICAVVAAFSLTVPASAAVRSNGKAVVLKVKCKALTSTGQTQPPDSVYQGIYGAAAGTCSGKLTLKARAGRKSIKAGKGKFSIAPGTVAKVKVKLTRRARKTLLDVGRLKAKVVLSSSNPATAAKKLTIKPVKRAK